jgi:hypothetical protein
MERVLQLGQESFLGICKLCDGFGPGVLNNRFKIVFIARHLSPQCVIWDKGPICAKGAGVAAPSLIFLLWSHDQRGINPSKDPCLQQLRCCRRRQRADL